MLQAILDVILETEDKIINIFEPSAILEASYREEGYLKIKEIVERERD